MVCKLLKALCCHAITLWNIKSKCDGISARIVVNNIRIAFAFFSLDVFLWSNELTYRNDKVFTSFLNKAINLIVGSIGERRVVFTKACYLCLVYFNRSLSVISLNFLSKSLSYIFLIVFGSFCSLCFCFAFLECKQVSKGFNVVCSSPCFSKFFSGS